MAKRPFDAATRPTCPKCGAELPGLVAQAEAPMVEIVLKCTCGLTVTYEGPGLTYSTPPPVSGPA